ncbi:MAG: Hsp20/alpha crystallin family protein [Candidatus Eisenbacteria bacterium]|uniref:Hsp20/alpha crystallin family protein n=1 Tax=Eiseniibacteriota bacterium TaxID=2212470 RepID=A0A937XC19_UNCEI|nr:Hsp20/alpha crystallin family protein [Candidatus Eisenbacteria bacterium]
MALVRWTPKGGRNLVPQSGLANWMTDWDGLFNDFFGRESTSGCSCMPAVDVNEKDNHYTVRVDLPGLKKDDIKLTFENDVLTITGERKAEKEEKEGRFFHSERFVGTFARSLRFPSDVDPSQIDASFHDGVLEVKLAKSETAMVRQIEVK